ncbi:MAG: tRNA glutamyl-Q(34) synthetase GluQRS [Pseudomonadota bacterium]
MPGHVERFAPSPTGRLHLGHAFSALTAWEAARAAGGVFRLRIEDLDATRARPEYERAIFDDLAWLGLDWPDPVIRQSERGDAYADALARLAAMGLTFRCACTRRDILAAAEAPQEGGPDGPIYPGTCRRAPPTGDGPFAIRLDMAAAAARVGPVSFREIGAGPNGEGGDVSVSSDAPIRGCGDVVLARKDAAASYHLAVVVDDAAEKVTHVTRGEDLFAATAIHVVLQKLLGLPTPVYRHHRLIRDAAGARLAKRADSVSIAALRERGWSAARIREEIGLT